MKKLTVGIFAHVDSGKTTLSEALLYVSGKIRKLGRVDKKDTFLDTFELEKQRGITIFSKQAVFGVRDTEITLIDTPGHADFSPEAERTLKILDAAILVISAPNGIQNHTETLWKLISRHGIPTLIFVNKTDLPSSDKQVLAADIRRKLSENAVMSNLLGNTEECAMCSEKLMDKYLSNGGISEQDITEAVSERKLFPVFFGSALKNEGVEGFLEALITYISEPRRNSSFGAKAYKITRDDKGTRLTHLKVTGGTLNVKDTLKYEFDGRVFEEKIDSIRIYSGTKYETRESVRAGTVCAVTGLTNTRCSDAFGFEKDVPGDLLEPVLSYSLILPKEVDPHAFYSKIKLLEEEEPTIKASFNSRTGEISVSVMGEIGLEVLAHKIKERYALDVEFGQGRIVYKETISETAEGVGHYEPLRHYSEVHLILEPGMCGSGLVFESDCNENEFARNWQRLVLTHLAEKQHIGILTGSPITDIKITLVAGKAHKKHTEGGDFREATYRAVRHGLRRAGCVLLEPYYKFELRVPSSFIGRAMTDIQRMSGKCLPPEQDESGNAVLSGIAPVSEMRMYPLEVRNYTKGAGTLILSLDGYRKCHNEEEVIQSIGYNPDADIYNSADSVFCEGGAGFAVPWHEVENHMHIESVLKSASANTDDERTVERRAEDFIERAATDKELLEIFERTYGKIKRRDTKTTFNPSARSVPAQVQNKKPRPMPQFDGKVYLLVDGYNIIFAWDELKWLASESLDSARNELIHRLCNYQGFSGEEVILVFDAYKVRKNPGTIEKFRNISVVYTKEAETADTYIERTSHELSKKHRVKVATSDGPEQMIILGSGALRIPAAAFHKELADTEKAIREIIGLEL